MSLLLENGQIVALSQRGRKLDSAAIVAGDHPLISSSGLDAILERVCNILSDYHDRYPLRMGLLREELPQGYGEGGSVLFVVFRLAHQSSHLQGDLFIYLGMCPFRLGYDQRLAGVGV